MNVREEMKKAKQLKPIQTFEDLPNNETPSFTKEYLKRMMPSKSTVRITDEIVDSINKFIDESQCHKELMQERLCTHLQLLGPGVSFRHILNAIKFVTLSVTPGMNQSKAYALTFPEKAQEIQERGQRVNSFASQYASTKIPRIITENIQIGAAVVYAPLRHQVVQKYINLMNGVAADGKASATVQLNAAVALMDYIKVPEDMTINVNHSADKEAKEIQQNLADQIERMAELQAKRMAKGENLKDVQKLEIIADAEVIDE